MKMQLKIISVLVASLTVNFVFAMEDVCSPNEATLPLGIAVVSGWCHENKKNQNSSTATSTPFSLDGKTKAAMVFQNNGLEDLEIYGIGGFVYKKGKQTEKGTHKKLKGVKLKITQDNKKIKDLSYDDEQDEEAFSKNKKTGLVIFKTDGTFEVNIEGKGMSCDGTHFIDLYARSIGTCKTIDGPLRVQLLDIENAKKIK